jgi:hypothetical protein
MGGKSSPPPPDYAPLARASTEAAQIMAGLGREQLAFARQQYGEMAPLARRVSESMISAQDEQTRQARDYYEDYRTTFRPVEQGLVRDVEEFNTEAFREQLARQAAAEAGRAFGVTQQASERAMASMGVNPASGRFAGMQSQNQLGLAASRAGAMTGARERAEQMGYARRLDVTGLGRGLPGLSTAAYSGATGAGGAGINTAMAPGNQFMAGMGQGIGTISSGQQMRLGGLSNILSSQTSAYNAGLAQSDPLATIVGMGVGGWAGGGFRGSDRRLKEDIVLLGTEITTGLPWYEFSYIDEPGSRWQGVMAEDVEKYMPEAIKENVHGIKLVNYDMLGLQMVEVRNG